VTRPANVDANVAQELLLGLARLVPVALLEQLPEPSLAAARRQALEERGVSPKRVETHAYGAEKPVCARHDEDCWSQNRRVDIVPQMPGQQSQQTQQK